MSVPSEAPSHGARFAAELPFPLDDFQTEALDAVEAGDSVLVAAPTGSGKTVVAEFACWLAIATGGKCFYTTPIKALSNQKFGDLVARHGANNVGLLTGDNSINGEAPIVVMTTEVLRNMIYERSSTLRGLRWVVMDEVHYLQDPYRGAVWEEVLIHLPDEIRVVSLSATISNVKELGDWLSTLRGHTRVILEESRPVELRNMVMVGEDLHPLLIEDEEEARGKRRRGPQVNPELQRAWAKGTAAAARYGHKVGRRRRPGDKVYTPTRVEVALTLDQARMLPAICFIFSRVGCDKAVEGCVNAHVMLTSEEEAERIVHFVEMRTNDLAEDDLRALNYGMFLEGLRRGIAAHHAGMLPVFKETVEELFKMGLVKVVFATETLALGINMPAKTVVIERLSKFTGEGHELLTPTDYTQLTGRAGRRGIDDLGFGVVLFDPWVQLDKVATLATMRSYELSSSFRPSYNMAVNLVRNHDQETATRLLNSSFAQFTAGKDVVRFQKALEAVEREIEVLRPQATCELGDVAEYRELRRAADEALAAQRGGEEVKKAFMRLAPGDVLWGEKLGKALVVEPPKTSGSGPRLTVMTLDRKLRRITPRDFRTPPEVLSKVRVKGQSWRSAKVRRDLTRTLDGLDLQRPDPVPDRSRGKELVAAYTEHPVHSCPDVGTHLEMAGAVAAAEREAKKLKRRIRRGTDGIARTFERVVAVLRSLGYVEDWSLTEKGELLTSVYNEADLLVVECLERGWFAGLDPAELAAVASMFTYEARGRDEPEGAPTPELAREERRIKKLHAEIAEHEDRQRLELVKEPDAGFMATIWEWARGASLEELLVERGTSAGDFVRNTKQVIDLLQQLRAVAGQGPVARALGGAVDAIQRGVVSHSAL